MFRPLTRSHRAGPRRGAAVLLTMFALIVLLMLLGLVFMVYAASEKALSERYRDAAASPGLAAPDPGATADYFFGTLIYDASDDGDGLLNAMRGHSIARAMYGSRYDYSAPNTPWIGSMTPWAGVGTFHDTIPGLTGDRARFVNHTVVVVGGTPYLVDPEWTGNRALTAGAAVPPFATSRAGKNYVGKHAGYTYPDLKNFFLAARDPATGEVLTPSFHRDWLFRHPSQPATQSALDPANPNWGVSATPAEPDARLRIARPRPAEHPNFPRVAPDADGVTRGDVQNLPGGYKYVAGKGFIAMNDSLWVPMGPTKALSDGRIVQPMVAALILAMDGGFNAVAHGNRLGAGGANLSYGGLGPWEVNMQPGMASGESQALIQNRRASTAGQMARTMYNPYTRTGPGYTTGQLLPTYAPVPWDNQVVGFTLPSGGSLTGLPTFNNFQNSNALYSPHPAGNNPDEFLERGEIGAPADSPVYPYSDMRWLSLKYAFTPDWYSRAEMTKTAPTTFLGDLGTYPYIVAPGPNTNSKRRLDPAHAQRLLTVPRAYHLDRLAIAPMFTSAGALALPAGGTKPGALVAPMTPYPAPQTLGMGADFAADNQWVNAQARLGSVNLNRPLADYRDSAGLGAALSDTNIGNAATADKDRRQLARDIFTRLVVALGAAGSVDGNGNLSISAAVAPNSPQYDALRYLAQVSVNLVDYIDNDDISTVFVWNPSNAADPDSTFAADIADTANRVVFGVEKPRLLLNEVYGEIANDPADAVEGMMVGGMQTPPTKDAHVRFWAELINPTATPHTANTGVLGDGSVPLNAYQIQIARAKRGATDLAAPLFDSNDAKYQENTTGSFPAAADATFTFPMNAAAPQASTVSPNNAQYAPPAATLPTGGFALVGPKSANKDGSEEFNPNGAGSWATQVIALNGMHYTIPLPATNADFSKPEFKRHVVLLRRAANPYQPPGTPTNPYVTVDVMDYVPAFDAVHRGKTDGMNRKARDMANATGYDPVAERFSVGKVQPLAGRSVATVTDGQGKYNKYEFDAANPPPNVNLNSMVLNQTAAPALPAPMAPATAVNEPKNTFGRHNGNGAAPPGNTTVANPGAGGGAATISDTIMTPYEWLVHFDRPLGTLGDVFTARDCKPYRLTSDFVVNKPSGLDYTDGYGRWRFHSDGLARGLAYLSVKLPDYRVAHGGRYAGPVNVNAMQDSRVPQGLLDPQPNNGFDANFVSTNVWTGLVGRRTPIQSRTGANTTTQYPVPVPTQSANDADGGTDRPILPFGAPAAAGVYAYSTPAAGTTTTEDTILRRDPTTQLPYLYLPGQSNAYTQSEPFRKVVNNVTTVSHTFVVYLTIGYFDVKGRTTAGWPKDVPDLEFGAEVYDKIPGDLRQKYVAVVDMTNMALKAQPAANDPDPHATERPFFTALDETAYKGSGTLSLAYTRYDATAQVLYVNADGFEKPIQAGTTLVLGYGVNEQVVSVAAVSGISAAGSGVVTLSTPLARDAWAGTCVSNVRPGYAGPRTDFSITSDKYRPVLPYVERLR